MNDVASSPYDARAIANFLLDLADHDRHELTQIILLKIIYFSHGWFLAETGRPLVKQPIEAWKFGPVISVVREAFKECKAAPIKNRADRLILETGEFIRVEPNLSAEDASFVHSIYRTYVVHDAWTLSDMTHEKGSPWDNVWNAKNAVGRLGLRIKNEDIRQHFLNLPQRFMMQ